jgi:hypothetical protein
MLTIEADVRNPGGRLRPGSFVRVAIITEEADMAIAVPTRGVTTFAGVEKVWVVQDGKAQEKAVTTGQRTEEWTEITEGVAVGDMVIVDPGALRSGQAVNVLR